MINPMFTNMRAVAESWSHTLASVVRSQWMLLDTGLQAAQALLASTSAVVPTGKAAHRRAIETAGYGTEVLINLAVQRMRKGLAPPRQIYEAQYRNRIDWSQFPEWVRPSDPELFEGASHEG
jgi:hypothetical protein